MPVLNHDLFVDVARELIKENNQDSIFKLAVSGREPLRAVIDTFKSAKSVKLSLTSYAIGWDENKLCHFDINNEESLSNLLFNYIGTCVKNLHLAYQNMPMYSSLITELIDVRQISSLTLDVSTDYVLASQLLTALSTSLKILKLPHIALSQNLIQLPLGLECLTILDQHMTLVMCFNFEKKSLSISCDFWQWKQLLIGKFVRTNQNMSQFTRLTFYSETNHTIAFTDVNPFFLMRVFPSLEKLHFNLELMSRSYFKPDNFEEFLVKLKNAFGSRASVLSKMVYTINGTKIPNFGFLDRNFSFELIPCYHRKFLYHQSRTTVFEVVVAKHK